jgi:hypothetical protein
MTFLVCLLQEKLLILMLNVEDLTSRGHGKAAWLPVWLPQKALVRIANL